MLTATPVQVILPTPFPNPPATYTPHYQGTLTIENSPLVKIGGDAVTVAGGATVKIIWIDAPPDIQRVDFYQLDFSGGRILLGTDQDAADGVSFDWYAPSGHKGQITASSSDGSIPSKVLTISVSAFK